MVRASTFLTNAWVFLVMTIVLVAAGCAGTAAVVSTRFVALALPDFVVSLWWLWPLLLVVSPIGAWRTVQHFRRGASLARIEKGGIPGWARVQSVKHANWIDGKTSRDAVFFLTLEVQHADGTTHIAAAEDVLPQKVGDALYTTWLPVFLDPQNAANAAVQWHQVK